MSLRIRPRFSIYMYAGQSAEGQCVLISRAWCVCIQVKLSQVRTFACIAMRRSLSKPPADATCMRQHRSGRACAAANVDREVRHPVPGSRQARQHAAVPAAGSLQTRTASIRSPPMNPETRRTQGGAWSALSHFAIATVNSQRRLAELP